MIKSFKILLLLIMVASCQNESQEAPKTMTKKQPQPKTAITTQPTFATIVDHVNATGMVASDEETKLSFKTGGIIRRIYVEEGQKVRKGKVLATLDTEEIDSKVSQSGLATTQAEIQLKNAQLALSKAERDYTDIKKLFEDKVVTINEMKDASLAVDNAQNQMNLAEQSVKMSKENKKVAGYNQSKSVIKAPAKGVILKKMASANELAGPGTPILLFGSAQASMVLKAGFTDKDIVKIEIGNRATITFDAYPGEEFDGKVKELAGLPDPTTGTYNAEISIKTKGKKILSGFVGEARISTSKSQKVFQIPIDALVNGNGATGRVFVVENSQVKEKLVQILRIEGNKILITDGLAEGDTVISKSVGRYEPGDLITANIAASK